MKRSLLLLFVFCFLAFPAVAQEVYTITEAELERLEVICENWEKNRQTLQLQAQSLKVRLTEASLKSQTLQSQLTEARQALKNSEQSLEKYENEVSVELELKTKQIEKIKRQGHRLKLALVIVSCILGFLILGGAMFLILKMKLKLL